MLQSLRTKFFFCILFFTLTFSCTPPSELPLAQYNNWLTNEENGLVKLKSVQHVNFIARYLPGELLAYREWKETSDFGSYDSILNYYKCGLVFQLSLQADKEDTKYGNLLYYDAKTQEDINERITFLNFNLESILFLEHKGVKYNPVLTQFEGFDQIRNQVNFQASFIIPEYNCGASNPDFQDVRLVFEDPVWNLGVNNFEFDGKKIREIPKLIL